MAITIRIRANGRPETTVAIPDGASVTIEPNGDIDICVEHLELPVDFNRTSRICSGPTSRYSIKAATTGYGKPPAVGGFADVFTNIHDRDPTDPEVRPLVRGALVTHTSDPDPASRKCRDVEIELELSQAEIDRIREHEHRGSFTFCPVDFPNAERT